MMCTHECPTMFLVIHAEYTQESRHTGEKSKCHEKERLVWMEINFALGKNGGHNPSGLGGRLITVVR